MAMKLRTLGRHFRESFKSLSRNAWMTIASVSAVTVTLLLVGVFFVLLMNMNKAATDIENEVKISVFISLEATAEEQKALETKLNKHPQVESVVFSSKDDELDRLIAGLGEEGEVYRLYEENNPLYDVFMVTVKDRTLTGTVAEDVVDYPSVEKVDYGKLQVERLFSVINKARNIGLGLIIALLFTAMFLISNTIKITIGARRREIEIMKLVGAKNSFIRWPFFLEGLWLGILGAVIPIVILSFTYPYVYDILNPKLISSNIHLLTFNPFIYQLSALLIIMGALIGVWGSLMSVRKFLKH